MDRSASPAVEKPSKRRHPRRGGYRRIFDALSCMTEVVLVSVFLLSYHSSGVSASVEVAGDVLRWMLCLSSKPLPVFFVGNVIILAVAVLSGVCDGKNGSGSGSGCVVDDIYEEYVARRGVNFAGGNVLEAPSGPEGERRIILYDGGKDSRRTAAGTNGRLKNCPQHGKGRLELPSVARERVPRVPVAVIGNGSLKSGSPRRRMKAEKPADVAQHGRGRLSLPDSAREHSLEPPATNIDAASTDGKHAVPKAPSDSSSTNGENYSSIMPIAVRGDVAKKGPPQNTDEAEKSTDVASPRGRGRLMAVRDAGCKTVEDMSAEEFNQRVEKYIAKTRRFLQEESMCEVGSDALGQTASYLRIEHRLSF